MTISEVAEQLDMHQNSSRFHLEALVASGYASSTSTSANGPGRPPKRYQATSQAPEMHHAHLLELTQVLIGQLQQLSADPHGAAISAGRTWGGQLAAQEHSQPSPEKIIAELTRHLGERGFTTVVDEQGMSFQRCPFRQTIPNDLLPLVCSVHQGFLDGFLDGGPVRGGSLEVGDQTCRVDLNIKDQG